MRALRLAGPLVALIGLTPDAVAQAQTGYPGRVGAPSPYQGPYPSPYTVQPISDADQLANEIRALAANPLDLGALVHAGELAVRIGDITAAATFFARAERIDPRNARVKAGEGSLLVATERPGEALRRFTEAESLGGDVRGFAADRGLAYDLVGEQDRAQRDYRLALRSAPNDETQRRYALSLGISGKRDLALAQIDPLLRKRDRGAWRARAFILAMAGDGGGAERIATSMMPAGLSEGLQPFFVLLPTLGPADRAFAVHFGEVRSTPERRFDARLVPPLATLPPDPTAPVVLAAITRPAVPSRDDRRRQRKRDRGRVEVAAAAPAPVQQLDYRPPATPTPSGGAVAMNVPPPQPAIFSTRTALAPVIALPRPAVPVVRPAVPPVAPSVQTAAVPPRAAATDSAVLPASVRPAATTPAIVAGPRTAPPNVPQALAPQPVAPVEVARAYPAAAPPAPKPAPMRSEESILASILSDIKVPPSELEGSAVEPAVVPDPVPDPALVAHAAAEHALADRKAADQKAADAKKLADKKAADKKLADGKLADRKLADAKALADRKAAEEKKKHDPKLLEPSRIWVQVAGGATAHDLAKEWMRVRGKAAAAFKGKQGWTTPLRATNRVLTGPFAGEDEAQDFVNAVAKAGISAFVFTSVAGQKIEKLPAK